MAARLPKLIDRTTGSEDPVAWPRVYRREQTVGPDRLAIAASEGAIDLLSDLAGCLGPHLCVLYVLVVPRGSQVAGRYESPVFRLADVRSLLANSSALLEQDGRHHVWIGSGDGSGPLVYDRHNIVYAYGPLEKFEARLKQRGFSQGEFSVPVPHSHHYHDAFDGAVTTLLSRWDWHRTDLMPGDDD